MDEFVHTHTHTYTNAHTNVHCREHVECVFLRFAKWFPLHLTINLRRVICALKHARPQRAFDLILHNALAVRGERTNGGGGVRRRGPFPPGRLWINRTQQTARITPAWHVYPQTIRTRARVSDLCPDTADAKFVRQFVERSPNTLLQDTARIYCIACGVCVCVRACKRGNAIN